MEFCKKKKWNIWNFSEFLEFFDIFLVFLEFLELFEFCDLIFLKTTNLNRHLLKTRCIFCPSILNLSGFYIHKTIDKKDKIQCNHIWKQKIFVCNTRTNKVQTKKWFYQKTFLNFIMVWKPKLKKKQQQNIGMKRKRSKKSKYSDFYLQRQMGLLYKIQS